MGPRAPKDAKVSELEVDERAQKLFNDRYADSRPPREPGIGIRTAKVPVNQFTSDFMKGLLVGIVVATLVTGAVMGIGLGTSLSSYQKELTKLKASCKTVVGTISPSANISSTGSGNSTGNGTGLLSDYIRVDPLTINSLHNDCDPNKTPTTVYGDVFAPICNRDLNNNFAATEGGVVADIAGIIAYSYMDCMTACSSINQRAKMWGFQPRCRAITFRTDMKDRLQADRANCWLKNATLANIGSSFFRQTAQSANLVSV